MMFDALESSFKGTDQVHIHLSCFRFIASYFDPLVSFCKCLMKANIYTNLAVACGLNPDVILR